MRIKPRRGSWILAVLFATAICFPQISARALAEQGDTIKFSYNETTIHQETSVSISGKTEFIATVRASETQYGGDRVFVGINLYGPGGGGIYSHSTGWITLSSGGYTNITLNVSANSVGASGWAEVASARLTVGGDDGEFWAGNYGPSIESASLKLDGTELLSNTQFSGGPQGWTSSVGWQECHATQGDKPCASVGLTPPSTGYPADQNWEAVAYGDGKFVAVASSGSGNRVMTSVNGTYWTSRNSASDSNWQSITYADNMFVAVGSNAVMTSPDGIEWTSRTAPAGEWQSVINCGGLFVATATWGTNYVMTSSNGIDWTVRTPAYGWSHDAVACSASVPRFVSMSQFGRAWSSADGMSGWSQQNPGAIVDIRTVVFGGGKFTWLEYSTNTGNRYGASSTNGLNWSAYMAPANQWRNITYGGGKFVAVAEGGSNARSAYSTDGISWTLGSGIPNNSWQGVAYGAGKYVAVSNSGTDNRVMTSSDGQSWNQLSVTTTTTTTTTTTIAPYLNIPQNLSVVSVTSSSVSLDWDAPEQSNIDVERYAVMWSCDNWSTGYGIASMTTSAVIGNFDPESSCEFKVRSDNDTLGVYSGYSQAVNAVTSPAATVPTTTTTEPEVVPPPVETIPTENTTVSIPELDQTPVSTPEIDTNPVEVPEPEDLPNETIPEVSVPEETQTTADDAVADIFKNTDSPEELGTAVSDAIANADSPEEIAALVTSLFDGPMNSEEFAAVVDSVFSDDLTTEQLSAALDAVFEEPLSDEKFTEVIDAVLDSPLTDEQFAEVVDILESDTVTEEQVATAVDNILENGVTEDQATELATSEKVLESIDGDQATEIFEEIPVGDLSAEEEAALVEAVTDAPEEIKNAFEETIDVYAAGLDDYVAVGSSIDVGTRRSLIAATTVLSTVAVAPAAGGGSGSGSGGGGSRGPGGGSGGSGGGSNGGSGGSGDGPGSGKKDDEPEEEEEEEAEIEGPEGDEKEDNFTKNSIFKYEEGTMKKRFSPWGFIKKFSKETAAMAFTISGSVVVFATLSGETRKITLIATSVAFVVHYINAMLQNDEE